MEENNESSVEGLEFEAVEVTPQISAGAAPDPAGFTVFPTGLAKGNTMATQLWIELCSEAGLDYRQAVAEMGANKARKMVQVRVASELEAKKPVAARWYGERSHLIALHLGGVFTQYPDLRPAGRRTATVTKTTDKKGVPCLVISLLTALPKRVVRRGSAGRQSELPSDQEGM